MNHNSPPLSEIDNFDSFEFNTDDEDIDVGLSDINSDVDKKKTNQNETTSRPPAISPIPNNTTNRLETTPRLGLGRGLLSKGTIEKANETGPSSEMSHFDFGADDPKSPLLTPKGTNNMAFNLDGFDSDTISMNEKREKRNKQQSLDQSPTRQESIEGNSSVSFEMFAKLPPVPPPKSKPLDIINHVQITNDNKPYKTPQIPNNLHMMMQANNPNPSNPNGKQISRPMLQIPQNTNDLQNNQTKENNEDEAPPVPRPRFQRLLGTTPLNKGAQQQTPNKEKQLQLNLDQNLKQQITETPKLTSVQQNNNIIQSQQQNDIMQTPLQQTQTNNNIIQLQQQNDNNQMPLQNNNITNQNQQNEINQIPIQNPQQNTMNNISNAALPQNTNLMQTQQNNINNISQTPMQNQQNNNIIPNQNEVSQTPLQQPQQYNTVQPQANQINTVQAPVSLPLQNENINQNPQISLQQMQFPATQSHPYYSPFYRPPQIITSPPIDTTNTQFERMERNLKSEINNSLSNVKYSFSNDLSFIMKNFEVSISSFNFDDYTDSLISEITEIFELPNDFFNMNIQNTTQTLQKSIDEQINPMLTTLTEAKSKVLPTVSQRINELQQIKEQIDSLKTIYNEGADGILQELERERTYSTNFKQNYLRKEKSLQNKMKSIKLENVELETRSVHLKFEQESIDKSFQLLEQRRNDWLSRNINNEYNEIESYQIQIQNEIDQLEKFISENSFEAFQDIIGNELRNLIKEKSYLADEIARIEEFQLLTQRNNNFSSFAQTQYVPNEQRSLQHSSDIADKAARKIEKLKKQRQNSVKEISQL
ncbi:hypothetical protein GPJ56_007956 [Histomonas meleagridis]|uniref:uncharacterized protein n=1 Tax=Histomonas meleagridis TaxID=135588 RepID=UPI00355A3F74|nr:hypothetical protein GPJ56_007956 [Histomonas meleagridis]KAH0803898.1 hypothetical protein GO595_002728 [Histomonas meleagridis]